MTHNPPQPFYDAPIDRNHSVAFSYTAHTTNHDLMELSDRVWDSFPEETRNKIDPSGSNASNKKGKIHLRLLVVQLFHVWVTDPTRALSAPTSNLKRVNSIYNPKGISPKKLRLVLAALADNDYTTGVKHSYQRDNPAASTTKRIRASKKLHDLFTSLTTTEFDLTEDPNTPLVKLNENDIDPTTGEELKSKHPVEYDQTLPHVVEMTQVLKAYNDLLRRTHIHLANIDK